MSGLLGIGGGIVLVPAMVLLLGMSQHQAHGTSLAVISFVVLLSAAFYGLHGQVDWVVAMELAIGGVVGAAIGARLACLSSARQLRKYFGLFLIAIAVRMLFDVISSLSAGGSVELSQHALTTTGLWRLPLVLGIGLATGILSGLLGIGGGVLIIPAMILLLGMPQKLAQGISLAVIIPVAVSGAVIHYRNGNVRLDNLKWLAISGVLGGLAGARIAIGLDPLVLRCLFASLLVVLSVLMLRYRREA